MKLLSIILNLPWTIIGLLGGVASVPRKFKFLNEPLAIVLNIRSFWWYSWFPKMRGVRAMAIGNVVLLGPKVLPNDLGHELIHVRQAMRTPLVHPILYWIELAKRGYRHNKYEEEAYSKSGNVYIEKNESSIQE